MKRIVFHLAFVALTLFATAASLSAQNTEEKPKTIPEIASERADELMKYLKLEDYQVFQIDSTMAHDMQALQDEMAAMQKAGVSNPDFYGAVIDRWYNATDSTFEHIFTPQQWTRYIKSTYGKAKRQRDKRIAAWKARTEAAR